MVTTQRMNSSDIVVIHVDGAVESGERQELHNVVKEIIAEHGSLRLLFVLRDLNGVTPSAFWADAKLEPSIWNALAQAAVVSKREWYAGLISLLDPLLWAKVEYFPQGQCQEALAWLQSSSIESRSV